MSISPDAWQEYVNALICAHCALHGLQYQPIPDHVKGDHGLEGFIEETGHAIQAYTSTKSRNTADLTKNQKRKILDDLNKLDKFADWWQAAFQGTQLKQWTLMVPVLMDREVVRYARQRAAVLKEKRLPFIDSGFQAFVATPSEYPRAKAHLDDPHLASKLAHPAEPTPEALAEHEHQKPQFRENIDRKLRKLSPQASKSQLQDQNRRRREWYLRSENLLGNLFDYFPQRFEDLTRVFTVVAESIKTDEFLAEDAPRSRYRDVYEHLQEILSESATFADASQRTILLEGRIAGWLGDCSLDFPEV